MSSTSFGPDYLKINIKTFKYFVAEDTGKMYDMHSLMFNLTTIYKSLPAITTSKEQIEKIEDVMEKL